MATALIRAVLFTLTGILVFAPSPALPADPAPAEPSGRPVCILLDSDAVADAWAAAERLARAGCEGISLEGAGVLEARAPDGALRRIERTPGVRALITGAAPADLLASASEAVRARLERWNGRLEIQGEGPGPVAKSSPATATLADGGCVVLPPIGAAIVPGSPAKTSLYRSEYPRLPTYNRAWGAVDYQTSEFVLGRVAVAIVTPRASGEVWSRDELLAAHAAARGAMTYWQAQGNNSKIPIFLAYEYLDSLRSEFPVLTSASDTRWVQPLMASARARLGLGKAPSAKIPEFSFPEVYQVLNHLRRKFTADWAVMLVIGHGNHFTDAPGLGAYAYLGGPFLVAPNDPMRWDLTGLLVHESGHLFYALDEYCGADGNCGGTSSPCTDMSGYLRVPNMNSRNRTWGGCDATQVSCAMDAPALRSCKYTKAMMGIRDMDGDGILDILDTQPILELFERDGVALMDSVGRRVVSDSVYSLTPSYIGYVREAPQRNNIIASGTGSVLDFAPLGDGSDPIAALSTRPSISMNIVTRAEYRVDDGAWIWIRPDSSGYDAPVEDYHLSPVGLSGGPHTIEFRGVNSAGNTTETRSTWKERILVLAVALDSLTVSNHMEGGMTVAWRVRGKAWGSVGRLLRSEVGGPDTVLASMELSDNGAVSLRDDAVFPGHVYKYRVETSAFGKTYSVSTEAMANVPIRDPERHISMASPNPFTSETYITFAVPEGHFGRPPRPDGGHKPGPPPILPPGGSPLEDASAAGSPPNVVRLPVGVDVSIHDVTGRMVRRLVQQGLDGQRLYTVRWDGRDEQGRRAPQGIYFARLSAGDYHDSSKIVLIR